MQTPRLEGLKNRIAGLTPVRPFGRVASVDGTYLMVAGLGQNVRMGDQLRLVRSRGAALGGAGRGAERRAFRGGEGGGAHHM